MQNKKIVLGSVIVLIAIFFGAGYFYKNAQSEKTLALAKQQASLLERPYSYTIGKKDAKVQLVEFFDPACGTCAQFHPLTKALLKKYDGDVRLVLRYAPFHKNSDYAIKMLEGARLQGKFMEVLEFMFKTQRYWIDGHVVNPNKLWNMLTQVEGLNLEEVGKFMNNPKSNEIVSQDLADADKLGVTKTPGYIVNGKPLQNFGYEPLKKLIESEL